MILKRNNNIYIELIVACLLVSLFDIFFSQNPIFYKDNYLLYWLIPIIFTLTYGKKWIYISFLFTILSMFITLIIYYYIFKYTGKEFKIKEYLGQLPFSIGILLLVIYVISIMLTRYTMQIAALKDRVRVLSLESLHYKRATKVLEIVNHEFESQISRSHDSLTTLYSQIEKLNKLNTDYIFETLLDTIQQFTKVSKATIWEYDENELRLNMVRSIGYDKNEPGPYLNINNTVEGYVYRNKQFFTIRKVNDFQSIKIEQAQYNIMTIPISMGTKVWGVLNIEEIPFEKYSRYCEQLLQIIVNLAVPPLEKALSFELMIRNNDLDKITGLPLYSQFYSLLEDKLNLCWKDNSSLSIFIFDLNNFNDLSQKHDKADVIKIFSETLISLFRNSNHEFLFFKYKENNQISVLSSNLDQDGISFYLVHVYKSLSENNYYIKNSKVSFEVSVGYATQKGHKVSADTILKEAETLLNMSKM